MSFPNSPPNNTPYSPAPTPPPANRTPLLLGAAFLVAIGIGLGAGRVFQSQPAVSQATALAPQSGAPMAPAPAANAEAATGQMAAVEVPEVLGLREAEARDLIKARDLRADVTTGSSLSVPVGRVMGQYPAAGAGKARGGDMRIRISLGPPAGTQSAAPVAAAPAPATSTREIVIVNRDSPRRESAPEPAPQPRYSSSAPSYNYTLSDSDLYGKSDWELDILRNTIYAKYGRTFRRSDLQSHFDQQSWYRRNSSFRESWLSSTEKRNVAFIAAYQRRN